jgi:hypothetical protein
MNKSDEGGNCECSQGWKFFDGKSKLPERNSMNRGVKLSHNQTPTQPPPQPFDYSPGLKAFSCRARFLQTMMVFFLIYSTSFNMRGFEAKANSAQCDVQKKGRRLKIKYSLESKAFYATATAD